MTKNNIKKPVVKSKRKPRSLSVGTGSAIPFTNKEGHVMRLSPAMKLRDLLKMGVVEIHLAKPGTPLREGEWRDASPDALQNVKDEPLQSGEKGQCE